MGKQVSVEVRYFVSSMTSISAEQMLRAGQRQWHIENRLHWVMNVQFGEDLWRIRKDHAAQSMATLQHLSLNLLQQEISAKVGIQVKRSRAGWDAVLLGATEQTALLM